MKTMLVVGHDKLSRKLISSIGQRKDLFVVVDKSSGFLRVVRLIKSKVLTVNLVLKMYVAELLRKNYKIGEYPIVRGNEELLELIVRHNISKLVLFRAGLIINKFVLDSVDVVLNVHCARIPDYGGIGVINRALNNADYDQNATIHKVTERIDDGEVIEIESYTLDPTINYMANENKAYDAGITLVKKLLDV